MEWWTYGTSALTVHGVGRRTLMVSASALTVHGVGHRTLMLVLQSTLAIKELDISDASECFSSQSMELT